MSSPESDIIFTGSIPKVYESYLVPLIFAPFAGDMAARLAHHSVSSVLEIAAGTGVGDPRAGLCLAGECLNCRDGSE